MACDFIKKLFGKKHSKECECPECAPSTPKEKKVVKKKVKKKK